MAKKKKRENLDWLALPPIETPNYVAPAPSPAPVAAPIRNLPLSTTGTYNYMGGGNFVPPGYTQPEPAGSSLPYAGGDYIGNVPPGGIKINELPQGTFVIGNKAYMETPTSLAEAAQSAGINPSFIAPRTNNIYSTAPIKPTARSQEMLKRNKIAGGGSVQARQKRLTAYDRAQALANKPVTPPPISPAVQVAKIKAESDRVNAEMQRDKMQGGQTMKMWQTIVNAWKPTGKTDNFGNPIMRALTPEEQIQAWETAKAVTSGHYKMQRSPSTGEVRVVPISPAPAKQVTTPLQG